MIVYKNINFVNSIGRNNDYCEKLITLLENQGYDASTIGVKHFQHDHNINSDGIVGFTTEYYLHFPDRLNDPRTPYNINPLFKKPI